MVDSPPGFWEARIAPFFEKYCLVLCLALVGIACVRVISTYSALSLTNDEPIHLACGLEYVANHMYTIETQHPPLARAMQALGPYLDGSRPVDPSNPPQEGLSILTHSPNFDRTVSLMRLGNLPFFLLACLVVCAWSWQMFGKAVAVVATGLFTLLPTILADAGLATTDMSLGATVGAAFLAAILWVEKPTWLRGVLWGVCLALALLSKFTALGYVPLTLGLALGCYLVTRRPGWRQLWELARQRAPSFALAAITTGLIIWAAYWFSFGFVPGINFSLPAPEFFSGIGSALSHNRYGHPAFLLGESRMTGWWYYFPVALAVKTPIAFLIMLAVGILVSLRERARLVYLFPLAFSLGILLPAMWGRIDIGIRHIEPIYIGLSIIAALGLVQLLQWSRTGAVCALTAGVLVVWMTVSVAAHHPDYLAYFNGFAGKNPEKILVDSNYDWGQDLKLLSKRLHELGVEQFSLVTLDGVMDSYYLQTWYGLPPIKEVDDAAPAAGWTVISPTSAESTRFLWGRSKDLRLWPWYLQIPATERVGALLLYNITPDSRSRFLRDSHSNNNGDYAAVEPLYRQLLALQEQALGPDHQRVAATLDNLALVLKTKGDYAGAEPLYRRALAIRERTLEPDHPDVANSLDNLALLLKTKGDYAGAEPLYRRALAIREKTLGPDQPDIANSLNNLALLLKTKGDYAGAEPLYRRALAIREKTLGPDHPDVANSLNNLALLLKAKGDYAGAEPLFRRALAILEKALGPDHPYTRLVKKNLDELLQESARAAAPKAKN
jgi:tetratricopeptide (TPR) repeat protein